MSLFVLAGRRGACACRLRAPTVLARVRASTTAAGVEVEGVTAVRTVAHAQRVVDIIAALPHDTVHAWDTEVIDLDLDAQSPIGHGTVICASFFSGAHVDYGSGPRVWIDAYGPERDAVLLAFKPVLESPAVRKVWHNYGFDRHVLGNHGIDAQGFWADTMHMARLHNSSRDKMGLGGYSLAKLSEHFVEKRGVAPAKTPMLDLFGKPRTKKNGEDSKVKELPPLEDIQASGDRATAAAWIQYSTLDAEVTWHLYQALKEELSRPAEAAWRPAPVCFHDVQFDSVNAMALQPGERDTEAHPPVLWELYERVVRPFGSLLTDMERRGLLLDGAQIAAATLAAEAERVAIIDRFKTWAAAFTGHPDMRFINVHSDQQRSQFLFGLPRPPDKPVAARPAGAGAGAAGSDGSGEGDWMVGDLHAALPPPVKAKTSKSKKKKLKAAAAAAEVEASALLVAVEAQPIESDDSVRSASSTAEVFPAVEGAGGRAGVHPLQSSPITRPAAKGRKVGGAGAPPQAERGGRIAGTDVEADGGGLGEGLQRRKTASPRAQGDGATDEGVQVTGQAGAPASTTAGTTSTVVSHHRSTCPGRLGSGGIGPTLPAAGPPLPFPPPYGHPHSALLPSLAAILARRFSTAAPPFARAASVAALRLVSPQPCGGLGMGHSRAGWGGGRRVSTSPTNPCSVGGTAAVVKSVKASRGGKTGVRKRGKGRAAAAPAALDRAGEGETASGGEGMLGSHSIGLGDSSDSELEYALANASTDLYEEDTGGEEEEKEEEDEEEEDEEEEHLRATLSAIDEEGAHSADGTREEGSEGDSGATHSLRKRPPGKEGEGGGEELGAYSRHLAEEGEGGGDTGVAELVIDATPPSAASVLMGGYRPPPQLVHPPSPSSIARGLAALPTAPPPSPADCLSPLYEFDTENVEGWVEEGKAKAKKKRPFSVTSLLLPVTERTPKGRASGTAASIRKLLGKPVEEGVAYKHLTAHGCSHTAAKEACARIGDLLTLSAVDTVIETFLLPLGLAAAGDAESRVHCSLNLNTETGRLSARRPNLQNQPSLERDRFKIRSAFIAPPGKAFVVADYGQLELRVLAHLTGCTSMIAAFKAGGDFHSRTAMGMYPHVKAAVEGGEVILEWPEDGSAGPPPRPLLKDRFKEERRKAKILNFSIAYGKTAYGLSKDWGVSLPEAEGTVAAWYADRPEVERWQVDTKTSARTRKPHRVYTILGRHRDLPGINDKRLRNHLERAAINTPIQGSAADIVMCAMLRLAEDPALRRMGYVQVLQVHDEVVLEGPAEHGAEAKDRVVEVMGRPFDAPLLVDLAVDAKVVKSWGDAK